MFPMMGWDWDWGWGWAAFVGSIIMLIILCVPWFFFLWNLQTLLQRVDPRNRAMPPGHVWLNFIPIFNLGWFIYTVIKIKESLLAEYGLRGWTPEGDQGYNVGIATGVLAIASFFLGWVPVIGWAVGIAQLICWVLYWLKTNELKNRLGGPATWPYTAQGGYPGGGAGPYGPAGPPPYEQQPSAQAGAAGAAWAARQQPPLLPRPRAASGRTVAETPPPKTWAAPPVWPNSSTEEAAVDVPAAAVLPAEDAVDAEEQARLCAACGKDYELGDKFCRTCGLRLP